jgi:hypothetical protein
MPRSHRGVATRIAAAVLIAGLVSPALARAAEDAEGTPAEEVSEDVTEDVPAEPPLIRDSRWYDEPLRIFDQTIDLIVIRPLAAVTLVAGAAIFVPAAVLTAPNGMEGITDAYERFVNEPAQYFYSRPLGEF